MSDSTKKSPKVERCIGGISVGETQKYQIDTENIEKNSAVMFGRQDAPMLVTGPAGPTKVSLSHHELDNLIGSLCGKFDLISDKEQRAAVKQTIKNTSREWLNGIYREAGYEDAPR